MPKLISRSKSKQMLDPRIKFKFQNCFMDISQNYSPIHLGSEMKISEEKHSNVDYEMSLISCS